MNEADISPLVEAGFTPHEISRIGAGFDLGPLDDLQYHALHRMRLNYGGGLSREPFRLSCGLARDRETARREAIEREAIEREAAEREAAEREAAEREAAEREAAEREAAEREAAEREDEGDARQLAEERQESSRRLQLKREIVAQLAASLSIEGATDEEVIEILQEMFMSN